MISLDSPRIDAGQNLARQHRALHEFHTRERDEMAVSAEIKPWTVEELQRLPDDGNKYEVIDGELFVTPAPAEVHEDILARLTRILDPFVAQHGLGRVYRPRAVVRTQGSEVEPDLMVRAKRSQPRSGRDWDDAPVPILVVEVLSPTTRRRDVMQKRDFYMRIGVAEYWVIDPELERVLVVRPEREDETITETLIWRPAGAAEPLVIPLASIFHD
jgi:Uma2 family endonuclease